MQLYLYLETFQSKSLAIPPCQFRVTEISFYIEIPRQFRHLLTYTTKHQSHGKENTFTRYTTVVLG